MADAYIVGAVRSAVGVGKPGKGALSATRADVLLSRVLDALAKQNKLDPKALVGSGRDGRVSKSDVVNFLATKEPASTVTAESSNPLTTRSGRKPRSPP